MSTRDTTAGEPSLNIGTDESSKIIHSVPDRPDTPRPGYRANRVTAGALPRFNTDPYAGLPSSSGQPTAVSPLGAGWSDSAEGDDGGGE